MAGSLPKKSDLPQELEGSLRISLQHCLDVWQVDVPVSGIEMRLSRRMTRTIASADSARNRITFAVWLFDQPQEVIDEVLCHEAAHLAVHHLFGRGVRPHGREWQALMRKAGFPPRLRVEVPHPPAFPLRRRKRRKTAFDRIREQLVGLGGPIRLKG